MKFRFLTAKKATAEIHRLRDEIRAIDPGYEIQPNRHDTMTGRDGKMFFFHIAGANNRITAMAHQLSELKAGREVIQLTNPAGGLFGAKRKDATPAKVTSHFAHVSDLEARTMLERLHPNGLPSLPATPTPKPEVAKTWEQMTWSERCIAKAAEKAANRK
jgi:hypothetical protein